MDNLLTVAFEAHSRRRITTVATRSRVGRDLLDDWTVAIRYGRTGQGGQELRFASPQARGNAGGHPRPAPPAAIGPEADRLPLPPCSLQPGPQL